MLLKKEDNQFAAVISSTADIFFTDNNTQKSQVYSISIDFYRIILSLLINALPLDLYGVGLMAFNFF
jgi:hypothetical protein